MPEPLWETMQRISDILHWLGKYRESAALVLAGRLMRLYDLDDLEKWENWVKSKEEQTQSEGKDQAL